MSRDWFLHGRMNGICVLADYSGEEKKEDKKVADEGDYDYEHEDGTLILLL